jgi:hypothetical protein
MAKYPVTGATPGEVEIPDNPSGGGGGSVKEGLLGASQSFPAVSGHAGYATLFIDPQGYFRDWPAGKNDVLCIAPGAWPPGYRVPNGSNGGGYPPSGSQAKGTEPIRLQPPVKGVNRVQYLTLVKILVRNDGTTRASFFVGLGVVNVNGPNRPIFPYLGYAHDLGVWEKQMAPETLGPGDARTVTMFRVDTVDNAMDGGAANFPNWPNWEVEVDPNTKLYPAVAINFANNGPVSIKVGNVFAVGVVL